jgi:hypothetical protein
MVTNMTWSSKPSPHLRNSTVACELEDARLMDLSINPAFELGLARQRNVAVIELAISGLAIHRSARRYIKSHQVGRNPVCMVEGDSLRTSFAIEDQSRETLGKVALFGKQLRELLGADSVEVFSATMEGTPGSPFS